jgi:hypothetical protein
LRGGLRGRNRQRHGGCLVGLRTHVRPRREHAGENQGPEATGRQTSTLRAHDSRRLPSCHEVLMIGRRSKYIKQPTVFVDHIDMATDHRVVRMCLEKPYR